AGAAKGGIWKTYNFLTTDPNGPTWIPLTNLGPLNSLNIGSLAAIPSPDGDPNKTMIIAGTGISNNLSTEGSAGATVNGTNSNGLEVNNTGVGFLRSMDGGRTWQVIDSTTGNVITNPTTHVQTAQPITSRTRDHLFDGTFVNQLTVDPTPVNGQFI